MAGKHGQDGRYEPDVICAPQGAEHLVKINFVESQINEKSADKQADSYTDFQISTFLFLETGSGFANGKS